MKKVTILIIYLSSINCIAQINETSKIGLYKWKESVFIEPCNIDGTDLVGATETTTIAGQRFRVLKIIDGAEAIIQILDYTKKTTPGSARIYDATTDFFRYNFKGTSSEFASLPDEQVNSRNYGQDQAYFKVGLSLIDDLSFRDSKISGSLAAGIINFPFKYRPQKGNVDFTGSFNFGAGIGYTFPHKSWRQFTHSVLSGYSISNIVLDSSSTNRNQSKLASVNNFSAFSFSLGYLIQYQKVQAGFFIGWDRLSKINQMQFEWQYQGKPWVSVGFGLAIFSNQKEKVDKNPSTSQSNE